jgi:predicted Holliday junction resolvase-like endonuclease
MFGDIEADLVIADGDQDGTFDRLVSGEVRKGHASNLGLRQIPGTGGKTRVVFEVVMRRCCEAL